MVQALVLVATVLSAQPREPVSLAAPDLSVVNLDQNRAGFYTEYFSQQLTVAGLRVITARQIQAVLGMERQRQLLSCSDNQASCMAELANALGTDGIVIGTVAKIGSVFQANISIIASRDGATLSVRNVRVHAEEHLLDELSRIAPQMANEVNQKLRGVPLTKKTPEATATKPATPISPVASSVTETPEREHALRGWAWLPAAVGVAIAGGGAALMVQANQKLDTLDTAPHLGLKQAQDLRDQGALQQGIGTGALVVGGLAVAGAVTMFFLPTGDAPARISLAPTFGGGAVAFTGRWP